MLIKAFDDEAVGLERVRKLMFVRVPLRLGKDVFTLGKVSKEREEMMIHMMKAYKQLMKVFRVDAYRACATSAMRDAENGMKVIKTIKKESGLDLEVVKGPDEALLLVNNLVEKTDSNEGNFAYVDVGGGSTEISLILDGTLAESHSYNIGTLRLLSDRVTPEAWKAMEADLQGYAKLYPDIHIIGSGGNINKLFKISKESKNKKLSITELQRLYSMLKPMSIEERMISFNLKDDRAGRHRSRSPHLPRREQATRMRRDHGTQYLACRLHRRRTLPRHENGKGETISITEFSSTSLTNQKKLKSSLMWLK